MNGVKLIFLLYCFEWFACKNSSIETIKDNELAIIRKSGIRISIYGAPWTDRFMCLFNWNEQLKDSIIVYKTFRVNGSDSSISKSIYIDSAAKDSIYNYIIKIKSNFKLREAEHQINDGTNVRVEIATDANAITFGYYGLTKVDDADHQITRLVGFINKKLLKDFQMY